MSSYVHGGTDDREVARLEKQADFTASFTFATLELEPGLRVLDLATGVGAMATRLLRAFPGIHLAGVDLSQAQLTAARRNHPELPVVRGDGTRLPFADATFDRVHCSWLLEHVPSPAVVLKDVRRVLCPGGFCQFIEVDNATFGTTPACPAVTEVMRRLNEAQLRGGGDPFVGQRLEGHLATAGFERVEVERHPLIGNSNEPRFFRAFVDEFVEIFEGLDESLGLEALPLIERAISELRGLTELRYTPVIARGWR
ncbi:MAG: methyltransferase domain-containing protein [Archangium sp.]|nr:methyltransferase domain-containing protein [Archangium sp.]